MSGASDIGVTVGDFATARVDRTFTLAYLIRNMIINLTTQEDQVACFPNAAAHLAPGEFFVGLDVGWGEWYFAPGGRMGHRPGIDDGELPF